MVSEGYQHTEVGTIPKDWKLVRVGELEPFVTSGSRGWAQYYSKFGAPFIRITNLKRESIYLDLSDLKLVDLPEGVSEGKRTELYNGDLLISITADIGIVGYVDDSVSKPAYINQHISLVRFDSKKSDPKFIAYFLASESVQRLFRGATDQGAKAGLNLDTIRSLKFAFPPSHEQKSISQALSDVDALIAALNKAIAKKRAIKTATMQQLLTGKKRLPGFGKGKGYQQTEVGVIPEDWEVSPLGEVTEYIKGFAFKSSDFQAHGVRVIRVSDTTFDFIKNDSEIFIDERKAKNFRRWALREGDLIISTVGSKPPMYDSMVGKATFVDAKNANSLLNQNAVTIRSKDWSREAQVFLHNHLRQPKYIDHIEKIFRGNANQASITLKELFEFSIPTPRDEEEKWAIATVLSDIDAEIAALETRLAKTQSIKQGMMQQLLTGKVRLKIEADMEAEKENG